MRCDAELSLPRHQRKTNIPANACSILQGASHGIGVADYSCQNGFQYQKKERFPGFLFLFRGSYLTGN